MYHIVTLQTRPSAHNKFLILQTGFLAIGVAATDVAAAAIAAADSSGSEAAAAQQARTSSRTFLPVPVPIVGTIAQSDVVSARQSREVLDEVVGQQQVQQPLGQEQIYQKSELASSRTHGQLADVGSKTTGQCLLLSMSSKCWVAEDGVR